MTDSVTVPMNPEQAREYEQPSRRMLWTGLLIMAGIVVFLILITMETRVRLGLVDPVPNARLDRAVAEVLADMAPLPEALRGARISTGEAGWGYRILLEDRAGELLYGVEIAAASAGLADAGRRSGSAINFDARIGIDRAGQVSGVYRVDPGVHVDRYEGVLVSLLQQALVAQQAARVLGGAIPTNPDWTDAELGRSWQ
jgi:hypothetical protein